MTKPAMAHHAESLTRAQLELHGARFCADCDSHHEYALVEDADGLAAYRMDADQGRRVAEAADAESAAHLALLVERVL